MAQAALDAFMSDHQITMRYHQLLDGKLNHMMDQTHLGYNYWYEIHQDLCHMLTTHRQQPMRNTLPPLAYVQPLETSLAGPLGASVEGSKGSVPGDNFYNVGL
jgi:hypothetical protein